MAEYIERKAVLDYIDHMPSELTSDGRRMIRRIRLTEYISDSIPAADVVERSRWIPVTERLPEDSERVLIRSGDYVGCGLYTGEFWKDEEYDYVIVTHWQPLPTLPKEEA